MGNSTSLGLPVAEHSFENIKNELSDFLGLPVAEHSFDNLKKGLSDFLRHPVAERSFENLRIMNLLSLKHVNYRGPLSQIC